MGPAELLFGEINLELLRQLLAVPREAAQELLVVYAPLVPVREQGRGDVHALPVPALRDHVDLLAGGLLVSLLRRLGVGQVEIARLPEAPKQTYEKATGKQVNMISQ